MNLSLLGKESRHCHALCVIVVSGPLVVHLHKRHSNLTVSGVIPDVLHKPEAKQDHYHSSANTVNVGSFHK
jgi:hypothetical protein